MLRLPRESGLMPNLLLAILLISAQFGSLLHAFEHDPGAPQAKYCVACATASQLSAACIDMHSDHAMVPARKALLAVHGASLVGTAVILVHPRGPPLPL